MSVIFSKIYRRFEIDSKLDAQLRPTDEKLDAAIINRTADLEEAVRIAANIAIATEMDSDSTYLKGLIDTNTGDIVAATSKAGTDSLALRN